MPSYFYTIPKAVNISLTLRNWIIGCYIREYEQSGTDRAQYGRQLLESLGHKLHETLDKCYTGRYLRLCRQLYDIYPQIWKSVISKFTEQVKKKLLISKLFPDSKKEIRRTVFLELTVSADKLVKNLSFSHFAELIAIDDSLKRTFYEIECIRGNWSVRELRHCVKITWQFGIPS